MSATSISPLARSAAEQWQRLAEALPYPQRASRQAALKRFIDSGLPTRREERWRYTDLSALNQRGFAAAAPLPQANDDHPWLPAGRRLLLRNGQRIEGDMQPPIESAETGEDGIAALNAALAGDGLHLQLGDRQRLDSVLHVIVDTRGDGNPVASHLRHRIALGTRAEACVLLQHVGGGDYLTTQSLQVRLAPGARLTLIRLQDEAAAASHLARTDVEIGRDAHFRFLGVELGGGLVRHDLNVALQAVGAEAELAGLSVPDPRGHVDVHLCADHRCERGRSRMNFRGVAGGSAHIVLNGLVRVHPGARKTDSDQHVAHLLLSPRAEVDAKPELEIYNDDVRCSHGATSGQLDEAALFYLRSRGVDAEAARRLLIRAFAAAPLDTVADEAIRRLIDQRLDARLSALLNEVNAA